MGRKTKDVLGEGIRLRRQAGLRTLRVAVAQDGQVTVTAARLVPLFLIRRFLVRQAAWIADARTRFRMAGHAALASPLVARSRFLKHRDPALTLVRTYIERFSRTEHWDIKKVTIRDQRARWGSCSAQGSLSFNYRLVFLPAHLVEYVVAHELCHLREHNHSERFWALLERTLPGAQERRAELRAHALLESGVSETPMPE